MALLVCGLLVVALAGAQASQKDIVDLQASYRQMQQMMVALADQMKAMEGEVEGMRKTMAAYDIDNTKNIRQTVGEKGGSVYIRWGRTTCPDVQDTARVYDGIAGGTRFDHSGGGANYVCLPKDPQWGVYTSGSQGSAYIQGVEYELHTGNSPFHGTDLHDHDAPCAVCHVASRGSTLMIPAHVSCPSGWTREYTGYLMAAKHNQYRSEFVCVDEDPESRPGGYQDTNGALFFPVEASCGSLPCPDYVQGRELTCVVCTN
ncbi:Hypp1509 [Branchiostoma lanceolatum]|uniref:Hypp1509 protein n=2 Tax=Branchiostoma lanceolatum TaxID=7740 RepID=A0A8K0EJ62_BRALA|nr:Hypp1509 [Branchiostoma lanceolatum]